MYLHKKDHNVIIHDTVTAIHIVLTLCCLDLGRSQNVLPTSGLREAIPGTLK